ncbi:30S ribosomal protein S9 [soil metagenome]
MADKDKLVIGRRKTSTARVSLKPGNGTITINGVDGKSYFKTPNGFEEINLPFRKTNTVGTYDVNANVKGGGFTGQIGAIRLAISRALVGVDEEYRKLMKPDSLLTRDPRAVERKKYGQPKARKKFQFSKR